MRRRDLILPAILSIVILVSTGSSQVAKTTVSLVPDANFGAGVEWRSVFTRYRATARSRGIYKDFVRLTDGRIIVADSQSYNFLIFDADGKFIKKLWKKGRRNTDDVSINNRPEWLSLWADKYLFVSELGLVRVFDLEGREIRHAIIGHPVDNLVPLGERSMAVSGRIMRKDLPDRYIAAIVDLETGKEIILMDAIDRWPEKQTIASIIEDRKTISVSFPFAQVRPFVRGAVNGGFLAGFSNWPEIEVFDKNGVQVRIFMLKTEPAQIEKTLIVAQTSRLMELEERASKQFASSGGKVHISARRPALTMPYFYNLYEEKNGNLLVFFFPFQREDPVYQIYSPEGELLREVVVETGEYNITFSPGAAGAVFSDGFLYTLADKKGEKDPPLTLMKFKLVEK